MKSSQYIGRSILSRIIHQRACTNFDSINNYPANSVAHVFRAICQITVNIHVTRT